MLPKSNSLSASEASVPVYRPSDVEVEEEKEKVRLIVEGNGGNVVKDHGGVVASELKKSYSDGT